MCKETTYIVGKTLRAQDLIMSLNHCAANGQVIGIDTETEGINPKEDAAAAGKGKIICWSISTPAYPRVFLWADQLERFRAHLESPKLLKVGHNIYGFDYHMLLNHGIELQGIVGDTMRMSRLIYCSKERSHVLKALGLHWLGIEQPSFDSLFMRLNHTVEYVQEGRKSKGEFIPMEFRETKRKVGEQKGVPTTLYSGERGRFGKAKEFIPLSQIAEHYPERLEALYDYASLDAYITRELYLMFQSELGLHEWKWSK